MDQTESPDDDFLFFSREYSQAVEALEAIRRQAPTLAALGSIEELRTFIDRFVDMARTTGAEAEARNLDNFAEWFQELIRNAEDLRN